MFQVIQTVDCKLCPSSVAFTLSCTCSLLSLKIMPKKISKESGDCMQSEEFQGGVKLFTYQGLRSFAWLVVLTEVVLYKDGGVRGGQPISQFPHFLPPQPQHTVIFVFIYPCPTRTLLPRGGYSCNIAVNTVPQSLFPTFRPTTARMVLVNRAKHYSSPSEKVTTPRFFCGYTKV